MPDIVDFEEIKRMALAEEERKNGKVTDSPPVEPIPEDAEVETVTISPIEQLVTALQAVNPGFSVDELAVFLNLPDERFETLAEPMLAAIQKDLSLTDAATLVAVCNEQGLKAEDLQEALPSILDEMDERFSSLLSKPKIEFIKKIYTGFVQTIIDSQAVSKRVVPIPIEFTSENGKMPTYGSDGAGGCDVYATQDMTLDCGETKVMPLDFKLQIPNGYAVLIHPRSGLSAKTKMRTANAVGLIDADYRGVLGVIIENIEPKIKDIEYDFDDNGTPIIKSILHGSSINISKGDRIAQLRLVEVPRIAFIEVDSVDETARGEGGYGSTGMK